MSAGTAMETGVKQSQSAASSPVGEQLRSSPAVRAAIEAIQKEVRAKQAAITGVRPASSDASAKAYARMLEEAGELRGRGLLYPYLGSGIGNGPFVEMADGSVKMDMICGIGVQFFGHSDADLIGAAVEAATEDIAMQGHLQCNTAAYDFARRLVKAAGAKSRLAHAFLSNSGAMSNENAIKICYQKHAPANRVIAFSHCFMGRTVTMAQIGDSAGGREGIPLSTLVDYMPFYDAAAAKRMSAGDVSGQTRVIDAAVARLREYIDRYPRQHAAFIFELVQGEGGFNTAPREFFVELMKVCKDAGIAVWDDEVQTFGRTTEMFAFEALNVGEHIDICTVGKMTQVCATLFTREYNPKPGLLSATFLGSADAIRVGGRILDRLSEPGRYGPDGLHARHYKTFEKHARALISKHPDWFPPCDGAADLIGGIGGMVRLTPFAGKKDPVMKLCRQCFDDGLIVFYCGHGPYHLRMLPPLGVFKDEQWATAFALLEKSLAAVAGSTKS